MLLRDDLPALIAHLSARRDFGSEELFFDFIGDSLEVRLFDESEPVDPDRLTEALREVLAATAQSG